MGRMRLGALSLAVAFRWAILPALAMAMTAGHASAQTTPPAPGSIPTGCIASTATSGGSCLVSVGPSGVFRIGTQRTANFVCDAGVFTSGLYGPGGTAAAPTVSPGCYNVTITITNMTLGGLSGFNSAICGAAAVGTSGGTVNCPRPITPVAAAASGAQPCPAGFTYNSTYRYCTAAVPSTAVPNYYACYLAGGSYWVSTCYVRASATVTSAFPASSANMASVTISPGAPNYYRIIVTGYVPTTSVGTCPAGTAYIPAVQLMGNTVPLASGPACLFTVGAEEKAVEITSLQLSRVPATEQCGGTIVMSFPYSIPACLMTASAYGMVVLNNTGDCSTIQFSPLPADLALLGSTVHYVCANGVLQVAGIPVTTQIQYTLTGPGRFVPGTSCYVYYGATSLITTTGTTVGVCPTGGYGTVTVNACLTGPLVNSQPAICTNMFDP